MQLSATTDYAIRIVLYLLEKKQIVKSNELSENLSIPKNYVLKVTKKLEKDGLVECYQGLNGGIRAKKVPDQISLWDIVKSTETTVKINKCLHDEGYCNRSATEYCPVRKVYCLLQKAVEERLNSVKMSDLMEGSNSSIFNEFDQSELGGKAHEEE